MDNSVAVAVAPAIVNRTVRRPNAELRTREHLTADEVEKLIDCASANRQGQRDALMMLLAFRCTTPCARMNQNCAREHSSPAFLPPSPPASLP
jgi:hypothetical protein